MGDSAITPPTRREAMIARTEQVALVLLALALVAAVAWRMIDYWRAGEEPLAVDPPLGGPAFRVNVNTAQWPELSIVPGLGPKLSKAIVAAREARWDKRFRSIEELKEVRGIADKMLAKLRPYLTLDETGTDGEPVVMPDRPAP
jgi:competence ComEA-like helix-hairpin-helix protein